MHCIDILKAMITVLVTTGNTSIKFAVATENIYYMFASYSFQDRHKSIKFKLGDKEDAWHNDEIACSAQDVRSRINSICTLVNSFSFENM